MSDNEPKVIKVTKSDKPFTCPPQGVEHTNLHPRVFLMLKNKGDKYVCRYCSTVYTLD